jgi:hypothetical protein
MPRIKPRLETSAKWLLAVAAAVAGGPGMTADGLQAAPEHPAIAAVKVEVSSNLLLGCGLEGRGAQHFVVEPAGAGPRTIEICNNESDGDLAATARALSLALDVAAAQSFQITSDPRTLDLIDLRLMRARTDVDPTMDAHVRAHKLAEIDHSIAVLEDDLARKR